MSTDNPNDTTVEQTLARAVQKIAGAKYTDALKAVNDAIAEQPDVARKVALSRTKLAKLADMPSHEKAKALVDTLRPAHTKDGVSDEVFLISQLRQERELMVFALGRDDLADDLASYDVDATLTDEMWEEFTHSWTFNHFSEAVAEAAWESIHLEYADLGFLPDN